MSLTTAAQTIGRKDCSFSLVQIIWGREFCETTKWIPGVVVKNVGSFMYQMTKVYGKDMWPTSITGLPLKYFLLVQQIKVIQVSVSSHSIFIVRVTNSTRVIGKQPHEVKNPVTPPSQPHALCQYPPRDRCQSKH